MASVSHKRKRSPPGEPVKPIKERPRAIEQEYNVCSECKDVRRVEHSRCGLKFENSVFECSMCTTWADSGLHGFCSFVKKQLRFFATDFYFTHSTLQKQNYETCRVYEQPCTHEPCKALKLRRRQCQNENNVYGWCAIPTNHKDEWDYEQQPQRKLGQQPQEQSEHQMRYLYIKNPYEKAAPWSPLYIRKVMEHNGER